MSTANTVHSFNFSAFEPNQRRELERIIEFVSSQLTDRGTGSTARPATSLLATDVTALAALVDSLRIDLGLVQSKVDNFSFPPPAAPAPAPQPDPQAILEEITFSEDTGISFQERTDTSAAVVHARLLLAEGSVPYTAEYLLTFIQSNENVPLTRLFIVTGVGLASSNGTLQLLTTRDGDDDLVLVDQEINEDDHFFYIFAWAGTRFYLVASSVRVLNDLLDVELGSPVNDNLLQRKSGLWKNRTPEDVRIDMAAALEADDRFPTEDEKDALAGTSGSPSSTNKYVTNVDSRLIERETVTVTTTTFTAEAKHVSVLVENLGTGSPQTITIPTAGDMPDKWAFMYVTVVGSGATDVTIQAASGTINGVSSVNITEAPHGFLLLPHAATAWAAYPINAANTSP